MKITSVLLRPTRTLTLLLGVGIAVAADQAMVSAVLQPPSERKPAPQFALKDGSDSTVRLTNYRGKVILLDFWATWCHGCRRRFRGSPISSASTLRKDLPWLVFRSMMMVGRS
jgi:thiol-disulfide isomerase/thioredoxin